MNKSHTANGLNLCHLKDHTSVSDEEISSIIPAVRVKEDQRRAMGEPQDVPTWDWAVGEPQDVPTLVDW